MAQINVPSHKLIHSPQERKSMDKADKVEARLMTHEEVCAIRYEGINARLARLEKILIAVTGGILFILVKILMNLS